MKNSQKRKYLNRSKSNTGFMIARFKLTPKMVYLVEALKVEGYWCLKNYTATIQNKNIPFLNYIESILEEFGVKVKKRVLIKIKPNFDFEKEDIELTFESKKLNFHIEKSPFDDSKKVVTSLPYKTEYDLILKLDKKEYNIKIEAKKEQFDANSELKGWAYLDLRFPDIDLLKYLSKLVGDSREVKMEPFLFDANKDYVAAAFSALVDAEGSVDHIKLFRKIRIRMRTYDYLKDWQKLLNKFDVSSNLSFDGVEACLKIEGWEDLNRLKEMGVEFHQSKKASRFDEIFKSYKRHQISRSTAYQFYINALRDIGKPVTARQLAEKIGKSKRVVNHYLVRLKKKGLIKVDTKDNAWLYFIK